ncbi:PhzF family phenazine biosynthesis protein [Maribacter sp. 2307UL18-2]|uniref:PhzF family phenazine biosynthesis protein n=1 Tax=Maribacter sp. 2307UL18-2 TaxID=3386274 RepID=UPI0039BCB54C
MNIQTYIVDAFTDRAFTGNPAGVCLLEKPISAELMQSIALELNLSETAFLLNLEKHSYSIRFFTPHIEIDFCGHATMASAKIVLDKVALEEVRFTTSQKLHLIGRYADNAIKMVFPMYDTVVYEPEQEVYDALGVGEPITTRLSKDLDMLLIEVLDKRTLLEISPLYEKLIKSSANLKEVVITCKSEDEGFDFYSRCFAPWLGINEDPVTGAAHSVLAKYWSDKLGVSEMSAYQLSKRGGFLKLTILSDMALEVRSNAKIIFEGKLIV